MKKYIYTALALSTLLLGACNDDEIKTNNELSDNNEIKFGLSDSRSRTIYDDQDDRTTTAEEWQLNWVGDEQISIYCSNAKVNSQVGNATAPYSITNINAGDDNLYLNDAKIEKINANGLQWNGNGTYDFFAVYPYDKSNSYIKEYDYENNIVTFNFQARQVISTVTDNIAIPEMKYAFMVAKTTGVTRNDENPDPTVNLEFNPIMTTLEINVKGQTNVETIITGVSIITEFAAGESVIHDDGTFQYNIETGEIIKNTSSPASTQTIYVEMPEHGVTISGDETLNVTAFVPPVTLTSSNTKIQVHSTTVSDDNVTVNPGVSRVALPLEISPSSKKILNLKNLPSPITTNNWITPLDNRIYVSQLSIPGTHDSGTGYGTSMAYATVNGLAWASSLVQAVIGDPGLTQSLNIKEQWDLGIRAFDFRPAYSTRSNKFVLFHGLVACATSDSDPIYFETELDNLLAKMAGTEEFAVIIMRHEDECGEILNGSINFTAKDTDKWTSSDADGFPALIKTYLDNGKAVMWTPELTLGDAAGKLVFLCRDWTKYTEDTSAIVGAYTSWSHAKAGITGSIYNANGSNIFYLQDWYASNASDDTTSDYLTDKVTAVKKYLDIAADFNDNDVYSDNTKLPWMLNHCSGYTGTSSSTSGYKENAASTNFATYQYLVGGDKKDGPTGIVLMDYVGARSFDTTVYGDLCPQAIIDNNYKLVLKRKAE